MAPSPHSGLLIRYFDCSPELVKVTVSQTFGGRVGDAPKVTVMVRTGRSLVNFIAFVLQAVSKRQRKGENSIQKVDKDLKQARGVQHNPLVSFQSRIFPKFKFNVHLVAFDFEHL
jgi:hypothetical protein